MPSPSATPMQLTAPPSAAPVTDCSDGLPDRMKLMPVSSWMVLLMPLVSFVSTSSSVLPFQVKSALAAISSLPAPIVVSSVNSVAWATGTARHSNAASR